MGADRLHRLRRPPAHIALLRELCVERHGWLTSHEFEDAIGAILGSAIPLAAALSEPWQAGVLAAAALALLLFRLNLVVVLLASGAIGALLGALGAGLPGT